MLSLRDQRLKEKDRLKPKKNEKKDASKSGAGSCKINIWGGSEF